MAPAGLPVLLASEVPVGPAADSVGAPTADPPDGARESVVGEERIADELLLKLGLRVSPRMLRKHRPQLPFGPPGKPRRDQRWSTFLKKHAAVIIAGDFCVVATATFRLLLVLVVMEPASRRIIHLNVRAHPPAAWTLQQLREALPFDHKYRFMLHDHDAIFSAGCDASIAHLGLRLQLSVNHLIHTISNTVISSVT